MLEKQQRNETVRETVRETKQPRSSSSWRSELPKSQREESANSIANHLVTAMTRSVAMSVVSFLEMVEGYLLKPASKMKS